MSWLREILCERVIFKKSIPNLITVSRQNVRPPAKEPSEAPCLPCFSQFFEPIAELVRVDNDLLSHVILISIFIRQITFIYWGFSPQGPMNSPFYVFRLGSS